MRKRMLFLALSLCLALTLVLPAAQAAPSPTFTDVQEGAWYEQDVAYVYEHSLMSGTGSTTFSPNGTTTRATLVTILYRLEGEPAVSGGPAFTDVAASSWYADAVTWAASRGIVNGTGANTYSPNASLTREQLAVILYRYTDSKDWDTSASASLSGYRDQGSIQSYARDALAWAVGAGLISGTSSDTLGPRSTASRAQVAAILHRFCQEISPNPPPANGLTFVPAPDAAAIFDQMPRDFAFASGVGGWGTSLTIQKDGTFSGSYHDSDMGDTGPGYPYGTVYICNFSGRFTNVTQVSSLEYRMDMTGLTLEDTPGTITIENNIRYIASDPYGLDDGKEFRLYLPGRATGTLPQAYLDWVSAPNAWSWSNPPASLPFWGLYNVNGQMGFFGTD